MYYLANISTWISHSFIQENVLAQEIAQYKKAGILIKSALC